MDYSKSFNEISILYNEAYADCSEVIDVSGLFSGITFNLAFSQTDDSFAVSIIPPDFRKMSNLTNISEVFRNTKFMDYSNVVNWNSLRAKAWEPFDGLKKIRNFYALYNGNNLGKLFKLDFSHPDGVYNIANMFGNMSSLITEIPHDYFDSMKKITFIVSQTITGIITKEFLMNSLFQNSRLASLRDSTGEMLMSNWDPEIDDNPENNGINASLLFTNSSIPTKDRLEFLNGLSIVTSKTYRHLDLENAELVKPNSDKTPVDITPYLINGKILNVTSNLKTIDLEGLMNKVPVINIPANSIVLPNSLTQIEVRGMFYGCVAHPDVTDISQVFIYNGPANIDYESIGLQLASKNAK